ncbi:MAG: DHH family phosphoesterase, partial [Candidatus Micrarchaeota archaeon]
PHYDADGLSAGAITALILERLGKKYKISATRALDTERLAKIKPLGDNFIFVDIGSGSMTLLEKELKGKNYAIIDHHKPEKLYEQSIKQHFNPSFSDYSGADEVSGAGACYLAAKEIDGKNVNLAHIAVVGALGDMQDSGGKAEIAEQRDS